MTIQPDSWIRRMAWEAKMIEPFSESLVSTGISFGTASYGYDMRISDDFRVLRPDASGVIDAKRIDEKLFDKVTADVLELQPHSVAIGRSVEYFRIPREVLAISFGKSTYARCGLVVNITPFEPEWEGFVTMSLLNSSPLPIRVYANEGIAQVIFLQANSVCDISYRDRKGKYQSQHGIVYSKVKKEK
ncbi:MAG: dCTP deaminase [Acidobacteria bacterium]|nr:dCTP deaminase [Acidobacteriota bacterium]